MVWLMISEASICGWLGSSQKHDGERGWWRKAALLMTARDRAGENVKEQRGRDQEQDRVSHGSALRLPPFN